MNWQHLETIKAFLSFNGMLQNAILEDPRKEISMYLVPDSKHVEIEMIELISNWVGSDVLEGKLFNNNRIREIFDSDVEDGKRDRFYERGYKKYISKLLHDIKYLDQVFMIIHNYGFVLFSYYNNDSFKGYLLTSVSEDRDFGLVSDEMHYITLCEYLKIGELIHLINALNKQTSKSAKFLA
jgi:hypothetical protein